MNDALLTFVAFRSSVDAVLGPRQIIDAELEEGFAGFDLTPRVRHQVFNIGEAEGDADAR